MSKVQTRRTISINRGTYERLKAAGILFDRSMAEYADEAINAKLDADGVAPSAYQYPSGYSRNSRLRRMTPQK